MVWTVNADVKRNASRYVVKVRSLKYNTHRKSCLGVIVEASPGMVLVAVHESTIDPNDNDVIQVRFSNNNLKPAEILIKKTTMIRILRVRLEPDDIPFGAVTSSATKMTRSDVFLFYIKGLEDMTVFTTSVIDPSTRSGYTDSKTIVTRTQKEDLFTFGCPVKVRYLIGAPVFSVTGKFVGMVHGNHRTIQLTVDKSGKDLIYAHQSINFIPKALSKITK